MAYSEKTTLITQFGMVRAKDMMSMS